MVTPDMVAKNRIEKKLLQALFTYLTVKCSLVIVSIAALLVVLLYLLSVLLTALFDICQQIAQVYGACSPVEKLAAFFLVAILIIWIVRLYRRLPHVA